MDNKKSKWIYTIKSCTRSITVVTLVSMFYFQNNVFRKSLRNCCAQTMRFAVVALVFVLAASLIDARTVKKESTQSQFLKFMRKFNKTYASADEYTLRLAVFKANLQKVEKMNAQSRTSGHTGDLLTCRNKALWCNQIYGLD